MLNLFSKTESQKLLSYRDWKFCLTSVSAGSNSESQLLHCLYKAKATFIFSPGEAYRVLIFRTD